MRRRVTSALRGEPPVLRALAHLIGIGALIAAVIGAGIAESYFTRGIVTDDSYNPMPHTNVNPLAVNTFFNDEPDPDVVLRSMDMIHAAGFGAIRQIFGWYEIEPQPGVYTHADGQSAWDKYDRIVELADARGIEIIARLEKPPAWARAGQPNPAMDGPPDRVEDYANFVEQVVRRYQGRIRYVQMWNEPNLEGEWGGKPINPAEYVTLLRAGYEAAKRADPEVVVLLAGLAPTDQTGPSNLSDLLFLQEVYDAGGAPYFDIVAVMVYGYGYSPYDRRVSFERNNFSRPIQTREIMVRNGDEDKPIWAVEYGWVSLPDDWQGDPSPWGRPVSAEQQAEYLLHGYLRARREWPWMGVMAVWAFRFPAAPDHPDHAGNPTRGFALVEHDFSPSPAWTLLSESGPMLRATYNGSVALDDAQRETLARGEPLTVLVAGDRMDAIVVGNGEVQAAIDGNAPRGVRASPNAASPQQRVRIADGLNSDLHAITLRLPQGANGTPPVIVGYVVSRSPLQTWVYPWLNVLLALLLIGNIASAAWMVRDLRQRRV
jgi:polysaccharide biosynthesis protein PslG